MAKKQEKKIEYAEDVVDVDEIRKQSDNGEELEEDNIGEQAEADDNTLPADQGGDHGEMSQSEQDAIERRELARHIPGYGHLFHVQEENLAESTRLSKQAIFGFAARDMQQGVLNPKRTKSAWDIFKFSLMRYEISEEGKGRDESITLHHLTTEEKEAAAQGGLHD